MPVTSIGKYEFEPLDKVENFHGNQLTYINWEKHLLFCAPVCLPLPPEMLFSTFIKETMPGVYGKHPDFEKINWDEVTWTLDQVDFIPDMAASLKENGLGHKSLLRFWTPGLNGIEGSHS
ncbi:MAG: phenol hydroxylase subunit P4 [Emcibacter sp.]|nr:phenol hydroxylase subunit P4 [Emcibacter sp.]